VRRKRSLGKVTDGLRARWPGFDSRKDTTLFSYPQRPDWLWGPPRCVPEAVLPGVQRLCVKPSTRTRLVPNSKVLELPMKNAVFWMLRRVALVTTDVSEEPSASIIRVRIGELGTLAVTRNRRAMRRNTNLTNYTNIPHASS
jgi:hypothetical protein